MEQRQLTAKEALSIADEKQKRKAKIEEETRGMINGVLSRIKYCAEYGQTSWEELNLTKEQIVNLQALGYKVEEKFRFLNPEKLYVISWDRS